MMNSFTSTKAVIKDRIKIAIVGCGRISQNHIKSILSNADKAELVALCDTDSMRLTQAEEVFRELSSSYTDTFSLPSGFLSYDDLLNAVIAKRISVDLVVLTTPSGLHPSQAIAASRVGLHVCTEKPMATTWEDGLAMVKACESAGVYLFVVKQNRFNKTLQLVKRQLESGRFGQLALVTVNVFWQRPQSYYDQDSWRGTLALDGGALMNQASHYIDLLQWLVGPVKTLSASIATLGRSIEAEDTAALQLEWLNGTLGTMAVTMLTYPKNLEGSITLLGEKGTVKIGGPAVNQIERWTFADESPDDLLVQQASYETTSVYGFGHAAYYANMLDTLKGLSNPMCDGYSGLDSLELLIAAYRSAKSRLRIELPLSRE